MSCRRIRHQLVAFLDGELAPADLADVEEHLDGCPACRDHLERLEATTPIAPVVHLDPHARHAMHQRLDEALTRAALEVPPPRARASRPIAELLSGEIALPRGLVLLYAAALLIAVGVAAGRALVPAADEAPLAAHEAETGPAASLELHRPAAYTPRDGWF